MNLLTLPCLLNVALLTVCSLMHNSHNDTPVKLSSPQITGTVINNLCCSYGSALWVKNRSMQSDECVSGSLAFKREATYILLEIKYHR